MEWCGAFGLVMTLIWLYIEMLKQQNYVIEARTLAVCDLRDWRAGGERKTLCSKWVKPCGHWLLCINRSWNRC